MTARRGSGGRERLIFALDVPKLADARGLIRRLAPEVGLFKVGKELFLETGPSIVRQIQKAGGEVFLDLKLHDIPRTVARAAAVAARLEVAMIDVHAAGGPTMIAETAKELRRTCRREGLRRPKLLAVTVLTSFDREELGSIGVRGSVAAQVKRLAEVARSSGADGVVASPLEAAMLRELGGPKFQIVTPGIRPLQATLGDQKRVQTPSAAILAGSDYVVVGRPIRDAEDPVLAARRIVSELDEALRERRRAARQNRGS